jgi:phenylpyruvate tautomerase PptA (4-oxalocrotonate tautomerase family)
MPTYVVTAPKGRLSAAQKATLGEDITRVHCDITGAPSYFAQVIFKDVSEGDYFVGGKRLKGVDHVYVHGHIRAGRDVETKERMLVEFMKAVANAASLPEHCVQVYLSDIPARQVLEFGKILPLPGDEAAWWESIPLELRDKLEQLGC